MLSRQHVVGFLVGYFLLVFVPQLNIRNMLVKRSG
jgi:hypothetical protein